MVLQKGLFLRKRCLMWVCFLALCSQCWKARSLNKIVCPPSDHFSDYMQMWLLAKESHQLQKKLANQSVYLYAGQQQSTKESPGEHAPLCAILCATRSEKMQEDRKKKKKELTQDLKDHIPRLKCSNIASVGL